VADDLASRRRNDSAGAEILAAYSAASAAGEAGYLDPVTGLFVFTAAYLATRGACCDSGCRHCPYGASTDARP
jgi:hypothetical protein